MTKQELEKKIIEAAIDVFEWNGTPVILEAKASNAEFSNEYANLGLALFELNEFNDK